MASVALIRGINVSGQKKVPMAELRDALERAGVRGVRTYIQSGNVIAPKKDAPEADREAGEPALFAQSVRNVIKEHFGYEVEVVGRAHAELVETLEHNPFLSREPAPDTSELAYAFLSGSLEPETLEQLDPDEYAPDELAIEAGIAYVWVRNGFARSKLSTNFIESRLRVRATMRNHRTVRTLIEMSE